KVPRSRPATKRSRIWHDMCGRFSLTASLDTLASFFKLYEAAQRPNLAPRWNIAPTQACAVVRSDDGRRDIALLRWGFTGPNPKQNRGAPLINARSETVA